MAEIFDTVDELPTEPQDGTAAGIRIPSAHVEHLIYHAAQDAWVGRAHWTMRVYQNEGFHATGADANWKYPAQRNETPATRVRPVTPFQFQIHKALHAGELWDAGLRLQEHLAAQFKPVNTSGTGMPTVALAWYPLADGDQFLSPESFNHGVNCVAHQITNTYIARQSSSGWQNTVLTVDPEPDEHLYPEIYLLGPTCNLREFSARHRWAAGTLGGAGSGETAGWRPQNDLSGWYAADLVYAADDDPVAEWGDLSGWGLALEQPDPAKQPVVKTESGIRFVRFDGTNDILRARPMTNVPGGGPNLAVSSPLTIYMVLRQRAAGSTQQVWLGNNASGATLIYRGDATDQVNYWSGGSDATYDRGSPWPSPWMVWSSTLTSGGALTIWEGTTEVFDGSAGTSGFDGLVVGNNNAESLPAAIDVAELIVGTGTLPTDPERTAVVAHLETKYGL